jgi:hypothetical protein
MPSATPASTNRSPGTPASEELLEGWTVEDFLGPELAKTSK